MHTYYTPSPMKQSRNAISQCLVHRNLCTVYVPTTLLDDNRVVENAGLGEKDQETRQKNI